MYQLTSKTASKKEKIVSKCHLFLKKYYPKHCYLIFLTIFEAEKKKKAPEFHLLPPEYYGNEHSGGGNLKHIFELLLWKRTEKAV